MERGLKVGVLGEGFVKKKEMKARKRTSLSSLELCPNSILHTNYKGFMVYCVFTFGKGQNIFYSCHESHKKSKINFLMSGKHGHCTLF